MKGLFAVLVVALLLADCGHAAKQQDAFVGIWQSHALTARLTIDGTYTPKPILPSTTKALP
jgi:hypothetical protein